MIKLLDAGFTRLRKNKLFWILLSFIILFALYVNFINYSNMKNYSATIDFGNFPFHYPTMIGVVIAIFTSLFLGVEYSDGIIRNKISIGHKRINIYLSNLIIITVNSLVSYILYLGVVSSIGIPLFGTDGLVFKELIIRILITFVTIIVYSSIFTFLASVISNKTITAIVSIMFAFLLMMVALTCFNVLESPKYINEATMINGETKIEQVLNPKYPSEKKRKIYQYLLDINPAGQMYQIAGRNTSDLKIFPLYSLGIIIVFTTTGLVIFKKKELK